GFDVPSWSDPELGLFCIKRAEYVDVNSFRGRELSPIPIGFVWRFSRASDSLPLHWSLATLFSPLATRPYSKPLALSKTPHPARRLSVGATRGPLRTPNCQREGAASRHLCIVQSRRAVPKILGTQVFS